MSPSPHRSACEALRVLLTQKPPAGTTEFVARWRGEQALLAALPPRFGEVLEALLSRIESAAMFGEESCSFSAADLRGELGVWLDKAERTLG